MVARIANLQTRAKECAMNLRDRVNVRLRQRKAELLHVLFDIIQVLLKQLRVRRRAVYIICEVFNGPPLPSFSLRIGLAEEIAQVFDTVSRAPKESFEQQMLKQIVAPNIYDDRH